MVRERKRIVEVWDSPRSFELLEVQEGVKSEVDGTYILGKVRGQFFVPDGRSRNERFYPKALWENALNNATLKQKLSERVMAGCIGHDDRPVSDSDLRNGEVSHVITKLWIDENNQGMGEALIIGTPTGQLLNTYLRAGMKLKTSTRADGSFLDQLTEDGLQVVDSDSFILETVDFVLEAGFPETNPTVVENLITQKTRSGKSMINEEGKQLINEMKSQRDALSKEKELLIEAKTKAVTESEALKGRVATLEKRLNEQRAEARKLKVDLATYSKIGSPKQIQESIKKSLVAIKKLKENSKQKDTVAAKLLESYKSIGAVSDIKKTIEDSTKILESYVSLGSTKKLKEQAELVQKYKKLGTIEEIQESVDKAEKCLNMYLRYGTVNEVKALVDKFKANLQEQKKSEKIKNAKALSEKFEKPIEVVSKLLEKFDIKEATTILSEDVSQIKTRKLAESKGKKKAKTSQKNENSCVPRPSCLSEEYIKRQMRSMEGND